MLLQNRVALQMVMVDALTDLTLPSPSSTRPKETLLSPALSSRRGRRGRRIFLRFSQGSSFLATLG